MQLLGVEYGKEAMEVDGLKFASARQETLRLPNRSSESTTRIKFAARGYRREGEMATVKITIEDNEDDAVFTMSSEPRINSAEDATYAQRIALVFSAVMKSGCFEEVEDLVVKRIEAIGKL